MNEFTKTIPGEWHWVCALFQAFYKPKEAIAIASTHDNPSDPEILYFLDTIEMRFTGHDDVTTVNARFGDTADESRCEDMIRRLTIVARAARQLKDDTEKPSAERVIEMYYRTKAQKGKITLKELAHRWGFNESYLRQAKIEYDRAGKWGAKSKVKPKEPNI
jgi:hypothetical protein